MVISLEIQGVFSFCLANSPYLAVSEARWQKRERESEGETERESRRGHVREHKFFHHSVMATVFLIIEDFPSKIQASA